MKKLFLFLSLLLVLLFHFSAKAVPNDSIPVALLVKSIQEDFEMIKTEYRIQHLNLKQQLKQVNQALAITQSAGQEASLEKRLDLLLQKISLQEKLQYMEQSYEVDLTKKRYKKGIDLIKMLYEKLLALDHHFSSLNTYQNVMSLSNPNTYPEFQKVQELINRRLKKDDKVEVPALLNTNAYTSTIYTLVATFIGNGSSSEKEKDLNEVSCILDFTAGMGTELSTIFYETEFLKESNLSLKTECITLFQEYTKVISYFTSLDVCRQEDDWEKLYEALDVFALQMEENLKKDGTAPGSKAYKDQVNLEFSVDRLLEFINKYNAFISQGEKYYKKFKIIVSNYPNEAQCLDQLPVQFKQLQTDIDNSIYKFNVAYDISELTGSKLKDLLYGFSD